jgi:hypothetical protein
MSPNSARVEGWNTTNGTPILANVFDWEAIERGYDKTSEIEDRNLNTVAAAMERGEAVLRKSAMASVNGFIKVLPNCGQQLYDVVEINDPRAQLSALKRRVLGIVLSYAPSKAEYRQQIILGAI